MIYLHVCKPFLFAVSTSAFLAILILIASHASLAVVALKLYTLFLVWTNNTPEIPSFVGTKSNQQKMVLIKCKSIDSQTIKQLHLNQQNNKEIHLPWIRLTSTQSVLVNKKSGRHNCNQTLAMTAEHATKTVQKFEYNHSDDAAERDPWK